MLGNPPPSLTFATPTFLPQGDGSLLVKPGRPVQKLTPEQFARQIGLSRDSVYRHIRETIPAEFIEYAGPRKILIDAAAVEFFREFWKKKRSVN
jgi:hypothetical protein